ANRALDAMRDLSHGLFPALLADRGLAAALESYRQHSDRRIDLEISPDVRGVRLAPEREAAGYFCSVETLAALDPGRLRLIIRQDRLEIQSEGQLAEPLPADFGQRLVDRAEAVGGSVQIDSRPAGQLVLCVSFPIGSDAIPRPTDEVLQGGVTVS
ncbi:MAG TPA: hypothetical protein VEX66_00235, partial [Microlunatus sp.]|nr:hypothetical protein [Microlunatus sp.]